MSYLVRHLTSHVNRSLSTPEHGGNNAFWAASDASAAIMDVDEQDVHLDAEEINARLESGELHSTDLVRVGATWVSLTDFEPVAEEAARAATREGRARTLKYTAHFLLAVAAIAFQLWIGTR